MKNILTTIFALSSVIGYGQIEISNLTSDSSRYTILKLEDVSSSLFENCENSNLTDLDFQKMENILKACISNYNQNISIFDIPIDLSRYKRQYVAVINKKGEKVIWINCFYSNAFDKWKTEVVHVNDGGNCFFNIKINLTTGKYYEFYVNGES